MSRPSTSSFSGMPQDVDARVKPGHDESESVVSIFKQQIQIRLRIPAARGARGFAKTVRASENRGRRECRVPNAPADGVTGSPGAFQASRASYGAVCGARRAACLEGRRSSLTLMV